MIFAIRVFLIGVTFLLGVGKIMAAVFTVDSSKSQLTISVRSVDIHLQPRGREAWRPPTTEPSMP